MAISPGWGEGLGPGPGQTQASSEFLAHHRVVPLMPIAAEFHFPSGSLDKATEKDQVVGL